MATPNQCAADLTQVPSLLPVSKRRPAETKTEIETTARIRDVDRALTPEQLLSNAQAEVLSWKVTATERAQPILETKWKSADEAIRMASSGLRDLPRMSSMDVRLFSENLTLFQTALNETQDAIVAARKLPQVEIADSQRVPRAYAVAESFLRAIEYKVSKDELVTFLRRVQDSLSFQMAELWDLKPLMELALLERIAAMAKQCVGEQPLQSGESGFAGCGISELIACLKRVVELDWEQIFEDVSVTEEILRQDPLQAFQRMDSDSRGVYRNAVVDLAGHSPKSEQDIARTAVELAQAPQSVSSERARERRSHIGYYLLGEGKAELKRAIEYQAPIAEQVRDTVLNWPTTFYFTGIALLTVAVMGLFAAIPGVRALRWYEVALFFLPALECGVATMNLFTTMLVPPRKLPRFDFSDGIPEESTTMVVIPMLLSSEEQAKQAARDLEVRYLGNRDANLHFALLTDPPDSVQQFDEKDDLAKFCSKLIEELNQKYAKDGKGSFYHFHRDRTYNDSEQTWMGWERKRGKLLNLNNLLLGRSVDFSTTLGDLSILPKVRYVITLDMDTQLPRDSARKLIGALAHPLNRAVIDPTTNTVVEGYGILQPRVGISVKSKNKSRLAGIFSGDAGLDPYTLATSDVYQDLFGEGIFTGKGIYEVETFQQVLDLRFPCNAVLSHDLLEGTYTRAGLISDVEVIDDYPSHVSAYSRRKHRWVRGDWQIIRWLLPQVPDRSGNRVHNPLSDISRWKIVDNIRRSLTEFGFFVLLLCGWMVLPGKALYWTLATVVAISLPVYIQFVVSLVRAARLPGFAAHWENIFSDFANAQLTLVFRVALLLHQSLVTLDAIVRTLVRMTVTRKRLLQWETAEEAESATRKKTPVEICLNWTPWICFVIDLVVVLVRPSSISVALPFLALWGCSKTVCDWLNMPYWTSGNKINETDRTMLRSVSLRTWRFFRQLSNEQENWLIPDIIHENDTLAAHQISPTNLGFLLNSRLAAHDLGWATLPEFVADLGKTFDTMERMPKHDGSFYNWYNTLTLEPLKPRFISTVDNGNLVCCLWTLKQGCLEVARGPVFRAALLRGLADHLETLFDLLPRERVPQDVLFTIDRLRKKIRSAGPVENWPDALSSIGMDAAALEYRLSAAMVGEETQWWAYELSLRIMALQQMLFSFAPWLSPAFLQYRNRFATPEFKIGRAPLEALGHLQSFITTKVCELIEDEQIDQETRLGMQALLSALSKANEKTQSALTSLYGLAASAERVANAMDFAFLYNPEQRQISIGYDAERNFLHPSHYDLLSSEARAAVFVAIAKGAIPQSCWFNLGRPRKTYKKAGVLLSWTGTMFEYLLPALWMRSYPNTLLEESGNTAVFLQQNFATAKSIPWGISESSCSERNPDNHYRYHAFGLQSLAISHSDRDELVISPYSSFLALLVDASSAAKNIHDMKDRGWAGAYGFYDACDFTPSRLKAGESSENVTCWMAHHQGMILVAAATVLGDMSMQRRFHAEPMVAATERLLQEKIPRTPVLELEWTEQEAPAPATRPANPPQQALLSAG